MRTHAGLLLLSCGAALGVAAVLASCQSDDIDFNFLHDTYVQQIAKMPQPVKPRIARPTGSGNPTSMQDVTLASREFTGGLVKLSLSDVLHKALANSLDIKVNSYSPGISAQDIITAEAAFDTLFFSDVKVANLDQPENITDFGGGQSNTQTYDVGFKKLLDTGATVQVKYSTDWQWANELFQKYNPHFDSDASLSLTQPLLQNFGTDVNKAQIRVNKNKADISIYEFKRQVMATLFNVEQAYWNLYLARQTLAIGQELLARTEWSYATVVRRLVWDALPVNVSQAKSFVATRRAAVVRQANDVKDAEDTLKNLLNDPNLPLTSDIAIVPTENPLTGALVLNAQQELWAGLEHRPELQEAELNISNANIQRDVAKNLRLPKVDMSVQWDLLGLSGNKWSNSMEQIGNGDFNNVTVALTFQYQLGNRAADAGDRKARLQQEQAAAQYQEAACGVMTQIQIALRDVQTTYQEMEANREAVQAATEELSALVARRVGLTPDYLDLELRTQETQAAARRALIAAVANYNTAIVKLEQQKGTLLQYTGWTWPRIERENITAVAWFACRLILAAGAAAAAACGTPAPTAQHLYLFAFAMLLIPANRRRRKNYVTKLLGVTVTAAAVMALLYWRMILARYPQPPAPLYQLVNWDDFAWQAALLAGLLAILFSLDRLVKRTVERWLDVAQPAARPPAGGDCGDSLSGCQPAAERQERRLLPRAQVGEPVPTKRAQAGEPVPTRPFSRRRICASVGIGTARLVLLWLVAIPWLLVFLQSHAPKRNYAERPSPRASQSFAHGCCIWTEPPQLAGRECPAGPPSDVTVLLCHGIASDQGGMESYREMFHALGCRVVSFDLPGHGHSAGWSISFGLRESEAIIQIAEDLKTAAQVSRPVLGPGDTGGQAASATHRRILIGCGASLGGTSLLLAAQERPDLFDGLIVDSAFARLKEMAEFRLKPLPGPVREPILWAGQLFMLLELGRPVSAIDATRRMGRIDAIPKLFLHGVADRIVPIEQGRELFAAAGGDKTRVEFPDAGHIEAVVSDSARYEAAARALIDRALERRSAR